jgi:hypothetical protein
MIDFHTHWIPSGLPDLAARAADPRWPVSDRDTFVWALARMARVWDDEAQGRPLAQTMEPIHTDSVVYQAANVRYLVDTLGADHVAFGTDFPLPVHADPAGAFVAGLDGAEAGWVRDGTVHVLLGLH